MKEEGMKASEFLELVSKFYFILKDSSKLSGKNKIKKFKKDAGEQVIKLFFSETPSEGNLKTASKAEEQAVTLFSPKSLLNPYMQGFKDSLENKYNKEPSPLNFLDTRAVKPSLAKLLTELEKIWVEKVKAEILTNMLALKEASLFSKISTHPNFENHPQIEEWLELSRKLPELTELYKNQYKKIEANIWENDELTSDLLKFLIENKQLPKDEILLVAEELKTKIDKIKEEIKEDKHSR